MSNRIKRHEFVWPEFGNGMYFSARDVADAIRGYVMPKFDGFTKGTSVDIMHGYGVTLKIAPSGKFNVSELQGIPSDEQSSQWLEDNWDTITKFWNKK